MTVNRYVEPPTTPEGQLDRSGRWGIRLERDRRAVHHAVTRKDAIRLARLLTALEGGGQVRVLNTDGKMTDRLTIDAAPAAPADRFIEQTPNGWGIRVAPEPVMDLGATEEHAVMLAYYLAGPNDVQEILSGGATGAAVRLLRTT